MSIYQKAVSVFCLKKIPSIVDNLSVRKVCVDDFAIRKRFSYGTVMVDLETHRIIDLIPTRKTVITKRLQKILLRDNRLIFVYNSRIRKYDVETGKLVYNKAVRHAFESEGEDLTQKFKGIYRTGFY